MRSLKNRLCGNSRASENPEMPWKYWIPACFSLLQPASACFRLLQTASCLRCNVVISSRAIFSELSK